MSREFWLEGPIPDIPPLLQPVAHALLQAGFDLRQATQTLTPDQIWQRPGSAASIGFHLRHIAGSMGRLFSYAIAQELTVEQREALANEKEIPVEPIPADALLGLVDAQIERSLDTLRTIPESTLADVRFVGRARRPSTVIGLLGHAAEHTQRHTGQVITTARIIG